MGKLRFHKMWEAVASVSNIGPGSVLPILRTLPKVASYADKHWFFYSKGGGNGGAYYEEGEMERAKAAGLKDFLDSQYREKYFREVKEILSDSRSPLTRVESADQGRISNDQLKQLIIETADYLVDIFGYYLACQPQCVAGIEQKIQERLAKFVPADKVTEIFTLLSTPTYVNSLRQEELDWLALLIAAKRGEKVEEKIKTHQRQYHLLHIGDGVKILSLADFLHRFKEDENLPLDVLNSRLENIKSFSPKVNTEKKKVIEKYRVPGEVVELGDILAQIGHWRLEMRIQGWAPIQYFHAALIREAGRRFGIPNDWINWATDEEALEFFEAKKPDLNLLEARKQCYLYAIENGVAKIYSGEEAERKFNDLVEQVDISEIKELRGNIAMKGKATGPVVVFRWGDDMKAKMELMRDNSILVAGQTRPELMPLITKSKAIVTDEGGITSHAAVVSRELGIPCIIGTKIATQKLQDGDFIEVDANNGVVRILNN